MKGKKGEKKENSTELQKPNIDTEVYNNNKNCDCIHTHTHTHTHTQAKSQQSNKNKVQQLDLANKGNLKLYLPEQN